MDQRYRNEKLTIQLYQRLVASHEVQCIEKPRFSDRHFWHGGYDKAYLQAQFQRLRHRRGPKKAICAVAASILTAAYHMLRDGTFYQDLGADYFRRAAPEVQANRLARQTAKLGFTCTISPADEKEVSV